MFRRGVQIAALLSAGFVLLICTSRAEATCGDYLRMDDDHRPAARATSDGDQSQPIDAPCGCRGLACQSAPLAPPAPKGPLRLSGQQDANLLNIADRSVSLHCSWARLEITARHRSGYPLLLNRPPDACA
jgi:hypothetical protein